jgi:4-amino-4-deoxy-L-arabinose transferase-like glycosyltransferase
MNKLRLRTRDMILLTFLVLAMALPGLSGLPVIDRDEARYAQATVQMLESGDFVNIRFQDQARNKKPAGAYWLQAASVKVFSDVKNRDIWAHRIPSVLASILTILATYWGGSRMIGRESALYGSALLAVSFMFVFEAHIAKTDALLLGFSTITLASLGHLRNGGGRRIGILFWVALGFAVMIKGPILPMLLALCFIFLFIWERNATWMKPLGYWPGPILFLLIIIPWSVLIWQETGGAFFSDAIGNDLAPKLQGAQEKHPGPPGYYLATLWIAFWPACLFLLPGLAFAVRAARSKATGKIGFDTPVARAARLLLCWSLPFFIMLEFVPTKLPHYTLITFPAFALMAGAAVATLSKVSEFKLTRRIGAVIFAIIGVVLAAVTLFAQAAYGDYPKWNFAVMYGVILICLYTARMLWVGQTMRAFYGALVAAIIISIPTYQFTLPSMKPLRIGQAMETAFRENGIETPVSGVSVLSTQFTEPSLVFHLGTNILLGKSDERLASLDMDIGDIIILDRVRTTTKELEADLTEKLADQELCLTSLKIVKGFNYAKGDPVRLDILRTDTCPSPIQATQSTVSEQTSTKPDP